MGNADKVDSSPTSLDVLLYPANRSIVFVYGPGDNDVITSDGKRVSREEAEHIAEIAERNSVELEGHEIND